MPPDNSDPSEDRHARARERMVRQQLERRNITDGHVLQAMRAVPRHAFVPDEMQKSAYADGPLPIGAGQTISQPYIVAYMTQLLKPEPGDKVLEIGVGSGYQTAVLAEIVDEVIGIERIPALAEQARARLKAQGYDNVAVYVGDGTLGYARAAPYDGILVAAASPGVPEPLVTQLKVGGRLVIPVGDDYSQTLRRVTRTEGGLRTEDLSPVRFVPLIGKHGFEDRLI
jgi:protein-L-isoaspartate(D-aspartate) O-methyltransferase